MKPQTKNKGIHTIKSEIDAVYQELVDLENHYPHLLQNESLNRPVLTLKATINAVKGGDSKATLYLYEYGEELLSEIHSKLELAGEEQQRLDDESPQVPENNTGKKSHQLSRACALLANAQIKLRDALRSQK